LGTVGVVLPSAEIKLVDVPDMNYTSNDKPYPRGELCLRGQHVTPGYYKDEKKTKELIDEEGWMHSGDIAASEAI
jgi:long-chain acyl-CoA synthetase